MKLKIKPYLFKLIKENILYLSSALILTVMLIFVVKVGFNKISASEHKIETLTREVNELQKKATLFQTTIPPADKLDEDVKLLNSLIPNIEDYFSIIYSLETLSQKTGFVIIGYSVNIAKSTANKLKLSVTGVGDTNSFMKFLDQYNFAGGRLITSDKIELDPQLTGSVKVDLTFYNKNTKVGGVSELPTSDKIFQELEAIKQKVTFDFIQIGEENLDLSYPRKSTPF